MTKINMNANKTVTDGGYSCRETGETGKTKKMAENKDSEKKHKREEGERHSKVRQTRDRVRGRQRSGSWMSSPQACG